MNDTLHKAQPRDVVTMENESPKQEAIKETEISLKKRSAKVITRCRADSVDSIKTAIGLRNLRDTITKMTNKIDTEIVKEQKRAEGGDELDMLASASEIEVWETKKIKLDAGKSNIASRASELAKETVRR
tara:strand:+ start:147 stop:536 length:390 start_codon:yes stop_codon:yes gene_type:complete